jgi:uncharacterized membrane protein
MSSQPPYGQGYQGGGYPPPSPPAGKTKVLNLDYNVAGMLCYLPICCINLVFSIIWLASEPKENRLLRFHALQSLLLIGVAFVVFVIFWFLIIAMAVTPVPGTTAGWGLLSLLRLVFGFGFFVVSVIGCIKAYQGQMWKLPVIGDIAEKNA